MNQKGFATMSLLALLPLLLSIAAFAAGSFYIFHQNRKALFECRAGLLDAQTHLLAEMDHLLQLNPQSRSLRLQKIAAQAAVAAAASNPPALAPAQAALHSIIVQQGALDSLQKSIIAKGNAEARVRVRTVSKKVSDDVTRTESPEMAVRPVNADLAPEYEVSPDIEQKHTIKVSWIFRPLKALPDWLNKILAQTPLQFNADCATTSEKGDSEWQPTLKRAKHW